MTQILVRVLKAPSSLGLTTWLRFPMIGSCTADMQHLWSPSYSKSFSLSGGGVFGVRHNSGAESIPVTPQYDWPRYRPEPPPEVNDDEVASIKELCRKLRMLVKSGESNNSPRLHSVARHIVLHAEDLDSYAIANVFHSCKIGGYFDQSLITTVAEQIISGDLLEKFDSIQIGMSIHSLGVLSRNQVRMTGTGLGKNVKLICIGLANEVCGKEGNNEQVLSNVVYGLGNIFKVGRGQRTEKSLEDCLRVISADICKPERLARYTEQALSNILYGWSLMGWKSASSLHKFCGEITQAKRLRNYTAQELCNVVYGLGKLEVFIEDVIIKLGLEIVAPHRLQKFSQKELCIMIHGLAQCAHAGNESVAEMGLIPIVRKLAKEASSEARMSQYNTADLAMLIHGFGILDPYEEEAHKLYIRRFVVLNRNAMHINREDLITVLLTCARLERLHRRFLELVEDVIKSERIDLSSSFTITLVMWCLSKLGSLNSFTFLKLCRRLIHLKGNGDVLSLQSCVQLSQTATEIGALRGNFVIDMDLRNLISEAMARQKTSGSFAVPFRDMLVRVTGQW